MDFQNNIIAPLLTAGALGFVNYSILSRLDTINLTKDMKEDKQAYLVMFGAGNYFLFTLIQYLLSPIIQINVLNDVLSFLLTFVITGLSTYKFGDRLGNVANKMINGKRQQAGKAFYDSKSVKNITLNSQESCPMYVYDFNNRLIFAGYSGWFSICEELDFEFSAYPFNKKPEMYKYEDLIEYIESIDVESKVYINTDKKIKIILLIS